MHGDANLTTSLQREWKRMHAMPRAFDFGTVSPQLELCPLSAGRPMPSWH